MTNREKYYSDAKYSDMTIDELADYISIHASLTGPCDEHPECLCPDKECLDCCRKWIDERANI